MSQAKVTEFFSTRKRNRFLQDEVLLNKQRKSQTLVDNPAPIQLTEPQLDQLALLKQKIMANHERTLRSRVVKNQEPQNKESEKQTIEQPVKSSTRSTRSSKSKENEETVKEKETVQVQQPAEAPTKPVKATKRRVNKEELKARIEQFNKNLLAVQNEQKATDQEETSQKNESKEVEQKKIAEAETKKIPAYLKYTDLASKEIDQTITLTLPKHYQLLLDSFKGSDTIIKFLFNRNEVCTFLKLRMGIQNITKHTFTLKHLGQMKYVYPEAYVYKQEKLFIDFKNDFHLIIAPNLDEIEFNEEKKVREFTPGVLLKRLNKFKTNLFNIVKKYHQAFLESIGIKDVPFDEIKRWHQKFDLENVKEIEESELPKPPVDDSIKCKTGQELLSIAKEIKSARLQNAIKEGVAALEAQQTDSTQNKKEEAKEEPPKTEKKEGSYNALLERIRAKEKQKAFESMVLNTDKDKNMTKYSQIKDFIRFLLFFFDAEKKSTVELEKAIGKMKENNKYGLSEAQCREILLKYMSSDDKNDNIFFDGEKKWLNVIKVRNISYLKIDKSFQINFLNNICDQQIEKIKSS